MTALPDATEPDALDAALTYAALGLRVVPIKAGGKHPPVPEWQRAATTDEATIRSWWTGLYRGCGVGIATGPASGVWVLDVDVSDGKSGIETLHALNAANTILPDTVTARTGSGGLHLFFAWPAGVDIRNNQSGKLGAGLDIRGDGGQVVAAPSMHASGRRYEWIRSPSDTPIAAAPAWLLDLLTAEPERPKMMQGIWPAPTGTATMPSPGPFDDRDDSIAAWYNNRTTWAELLAADGWTLAQQRGGEDRWVRPGKSARDGCSATVGHAGRDVLKVFTSSVPELAADGAYSRFGYTAAMRHGGDRSAFARQLRTQRNADEGASSNQRDPLTWAQINDAGVVALEPDELAMPDEEPTEPDHGWVPADAAAILSADYEPPKPTLLERTDGAALFYPERINGLFGESGSGKSWLALLTAAQQIGHGRHVLYVDLEDHADSVFGRLMALGVAKAQIIDQFAYVSPNIPWTDAAAAWTARRIRAQQITLVVLDSTGEAMALDGAKPNDDDATATWFRRLPRFFAHLGACVVLIDHQPKSNEGGATEIGSQRKRAAIDGATYHIEAPVSPARGVDGVLKVTCKKDRNGTYAKGQVVADVDVTSNTAGTDVTITMRRHEKVTRPTVLMRRISDHLEAVGVEGTSQRALFAAVSGKTEGKKMALTVLIDEGFVKQNVNGGNRGFVYTLLRRFEEDDMDVFRPELSTGDAQTTSSATPRPQRDPSATPAQGVALDPARPPRPDVNTNDVGGVALRRRAEVAPHEPSLPVDNPKPPTRSLI